MFQFKNALVISGSKSVNEAEPVIELISTLNNFKLNKKAMRLLGVNPGDRVAMFDMAGKGATDQNDRFYVCKSFEILKGNTPVEVGAKLAADGKFSYNRIYGAILCEDMDIVDITPEAMVEKGILYPKDPDAKSQYISRKVGNGKVSLIEDGAEVEVHDGIFRILGVITNLTFSEHVSTRGESIVEDAPEATLFDERE